MKIDYRWKRVKFEKFKNNYRVRKWNRIIKRRKIKIVNLTKFSLNSWHDVKLSKRSLSLITSQNVQFRKFVDSKFFKISINDEIFNLQIVNKFELSFNVFNVSKFSNYSNIASRMRVNFDKKINSYFSKSIKRFFINHIVSKNVLKNWIVNVDLILNFLISNVATRRKMLCLLHHYRHLNDIDLKNFSITNLIIHRVRIKSNIKLISCKNQKR